MANSKVIKESGGRWVKDRPRLLMENYRRQPQEDIEIPFAQRDVWMRSLSAESVGGESVASMGS